MNKKLIVILALLVLVIGLICVYVFVFTGDNASTENSNQVGNTLTEPDITVDYLSTDYMEMLKTDGATETYATLGEITTATEGTFDAVADGKAIVESDEEEAGYYVADNNTALPIIIDSGTRVVFSDDSGSKVVTPEEFVSLHNDLLSSETSAESENVYVIYTFGTQTVLILPYVHGASNV